MCKYNFKIVFFILLITLCSTAVAQDSTMLRKHPPKERIIDRMFFGGNIGAQFGTVTFIDVSPMVGYRITDDVSAGIGATYQYYHYQDKIYNLETNVYGGRIFGRYFFTDYLFAHAEEEYLNLEAFDFFPRRRVDVTSFLAGGGYFQRFAANSGIMVMLLYNFTESVYTPYENPIIRIGVNIGF